MSNIDIEEIDRFICGIQSNLSLKENLRMVVRYSTSETQLTKDLLKVIFDINERLSYTETLLKYAELNKKTPNDMLVVSAEGTQVLHFTPKQPDKGETR